MSKENRADDNDCPLSDKHFRGIIGILALDKVFENFDFKNMWDFACIDENMKCEKGITKQEDSLDPKNKWHKKTKFGWLAPPYSGKIVSPFKFHKEKLIDIQKLFVIKAFYESREGMQIITLIQNSPQTKYWKKYIAKNKNCDVIPIYGSLNFHNTDPGQSRGNILVVFGVKRNSISQKTKQILSCIPLIDDEYEYEDYKKLYKTSIEYNKQKGTSSKAEEPIQKKKRKYVKSGKYSTKKPKKTNVRRLTPKIIEHAKAVVDLIDVPFDSLNYNKQYKVTAKAFTKAYGEDTHYDEKRIRDRIKNHEPFLNEIRRLEKIKFGDNGHEQLDGTIDMNEKRNTVSDEAIKALESDEALEALEKGDEISLDLSPWVIEE